MKSIVAQVKCLSFWNCRWLLPISLAVLTGCSAGPPAANLESGSGSIQASQSVSAVDSRFEPLNNRAYNQFVNGLLFESMGQFNEAAQSYRKALGTYPGSYEIGLHLAKMLRRLRDPVQALKILDKISPQDEEVLKTRASCYLMKGAEQEAAATYLKLTKIDSTHVPAYHYLIRYYRKQKNLDSTAWAYRQMIRLKPTDWKTRNEFARLLRHGERMEEAKIVFRQSMELNHQEENIEAVVGLGEIYDKMGQSDSLDMLLEQGLEQAPDNILLNQEMGRRLLERDSVLQAIPYFRVIAEQLPQDNKMARRLAVLYFSVDSLDAADSIFSGLVANGEKVAGNHYYLGRIAAIQEDYETARDEFMLLVLLADSLQQSWMDLAFAYRRLEDTANELTAYRTGVEHMPDEESAINLLFALGAAQDRHGQLDSAVATFEEILDHEPNHAQSLNYLGYTLADKNLQLDYALELIEKANSLQPENAAFLDSYGWVYYRLGDYDSALRYLKAASELDNDPVILDHLGDAYFALGKVAQARQSWQKALEQLPDNDAIKEKLNR